MPEGNAINMDPQLSFRQRLRIAALAAAARIVPQGSSPRVVIDAAEELAEWIGWGLEDDD